MTESEAKNAGAATADRDLGIVPLDRISLGTNVRSVKASEVQELAASIRTHGILEPVLVIETPTGSPKPYALVAGFRRYFGAREAKLAGIPARLIHVPAAQVPEIQLIENLQREDLSELEEARAFQRYLDATKTTQADLAKRIGKAASYVSNRIRLLGLQPTVLAQLETGKLSASHAEVIAATPPKVQAALARKAQDGDLSVRRLEQERSWAVQRFNEAAREQRALAARLAKTRFKTCPVPVNGKPCGRAPRKLESWRGPDMVTCGSIDHAWSLKTGKAPERERRAEPVHRELPKPTLPLVPVNAKLQVSPGDLAAFLLDHGATVGAVAVFPEGKRIRWEISGSRPSVAVDLPRFHATERGARLLDAEGWDQTTDAARKKLAAQRAALESWKLPAKTRGKA